MTDDFARTAADAASEKNTRGSFKGAVDRAVVSKDVVVCTTGTDGAQTTRTADLRACVCGILNLCGGGGGGADLVA